MAKIKKRIDGYHATEPRRADEIINSGQFRDSHRDDEWLGTGVYFFYYPKHAQEWGRDHVRSALPQILRAELTYTDEQMLNLDDPAVFDEFEATIEAMNSYADVLKAARSLDWREQRRRLCYSCNLIREAWPEIGIISHTFSMQMSDITAFRRNQRQLCVSDHSIITHIEKAEVT